MWIVDRTSAFLASEEHSHGNAIWSLELFLCHLWEGFREDITISVPNTFDPFTSLPDKPTPPAPTTTNGQPRTGQDNFEQVVLDDGMNMDWEVGLNDGSITDFWNASAWNLTSIELEALSANSTVQVTPTSDMVLPQAVSEEAAGRQFLDSGRPTGMTTGNQPDSTAIITSHEKAQSPSPAQNLGLEPASETLPANNNRKRHKTGQNPKTGPFSTTESHVWRDVPTSKTSGSDPPSRRRSNPPVSTTPKLTHDVRIARAVKETSPGASHSSSEADSPRGSSSSPPSTVSGSIQNSGLCNINEILKTLSVLKGRLGGAIAIALCCVSANLQSVESSLPFLCRTINAERERLVTEFPTKSENLEDAMAALHATCIYQIETILVFRAQKSAKQQISSGELYHHFLLKMTRRLCQENNERISLKDNTAIGWHTWTMAETLRRTTFLVNMVNELSYHTNALNPAYYESLHPSLVLDMPLPAPETMWRALNEREWAAARDNSGWSGVGVLTLRDFTVRLESGDSSADESSRSQGGKYDNIQQISNLIISSARHIKQQ
ncbi:MAG: hypothetical protein Q9181_002255 [Wetmoreana brouardii]